MHATWRVCGIGWTVATIGLAICSAARAQEQTLASGGSAADLSGDRGSTVSFRIRVPDDADELVFETSGGRGDADLYVRHGAPAENDQYDERSRGVGNTERIVIEAPQAGWWYATLYAYDEFSGLTLTARHDGTAVQPADTGDRGENGEDADAGPAGEGIPIALGATRGGLNGGQGSRRVYRLSVPEGTRAIEWTLRGATGDCDLYVRSAGGASPAAEQLTPDRYDRRSANKDGDETIVIYQPRAGLWHALVYGHATYEGATLAVRSLGPPEPTPGQGPSVELLAPQSGQYWRLGGTYRVRWRTRGDVDRVRIEYSVDDGQTWRRGGLPAAIPAGRGEYMLRIPEEQAFVSDRVRVRVFDVDRPWVFDTSGRLEILPPGRAAPGAPRYDRPGESGGGGTREAPASIGVGLISVHEIRPEGDEDWLSFTPPRSRNYRARFTGLDIELEVEVHAVDFTGHTRRIRDEEIEDDGDSVLLDAGERRVREFLLRVRGEDDDETGAYRVTVVEDD